MQSNASYQYMQVDCFNVGAQDQPSSSTASSSRDAAPVQVDVTQKVPRKRTREKRQQQPLRRHYELGFKMKVIEHAEAFGVVNPLPFIFPKFCISQELVPQLGRSNFPRGACATGGKRSNCLKKKSRPKLYTTRGRRARGARE